MRNRPLGEEHAKDRKFLLRNLRDEKSQESDNDVQHLPITVTGNLPDNIDNRVEGEDETPA